MKVKRLIIPAVVFIIISHAYGAWCTEERNPRRILILNSYHHGFPWTDSIIRSIRGAFEKQGMPADFYIEYMDTKRYLSGPYLAQLYATYKFKYSSLSFDCIISTDDDALEFLMKNRGTLFGKTPVVFAGINRLDAVKTLDRRFYTGIMEEDSPEETVRLIKQLHPGVKKIYVISDYTTTGRARYNAVQSVVPLFRDIAFQFSPDLPVDGVLADIDKLDEETPVLLMAFFKDSTGRDFSYSGFSKKLNDHVKGPVYTVAVNYLGLGILGGVVNSPEKQGSEAAAMAMRILNGESPENIAVITKVRNSAVIDYVEAVKKDVDISLIPEGTEIINRPHGFYDFIVQHWIYVITIVSVFLLLTVIILTVSIIAVARINRQRKKIVSELATALIEVKTLSGLLPICSSCKKIRDDSGYWSQIEMYLEEHSDAEFTHSLCPDCARRLYPDIFADEEKE